MRILILLAAGCAGLAEPAPTDPHEQLRANAATAACKAPQVKVLHCEPDHACFVDVCGWQARYAFAPNGRWTYQPGPLDALRDELRLRSDKCRTAVQRDTNEGLTANVRCSDGRDDNDNCASADTEVCGAKATYILVGCHDDCPDSIGANMTNLRWVLKP